MNVGLRGSRAMRFVLALGALNVLPLKFIGVFIVRLGGIEPPTRGLGSPCSIP